MKDGHWGILKRVVQVPSHIPLATAVPDPAVHVAGDFSCSAFAWHGVVPSCHSSRSDVIVLLWQGWEGIWA